MVEETIPNESVVRLRELITTGHLLKQAKAFEFINDEDHTAYTKKLNEKAHKVIDTIISTIAGE